MDTHTYMHMHAPQDYGWSVADVSVVQQLVGAVWEAGRLGAGPGV